MLEELPEDKATGDLAVIYAEIRELTRVPYVSSLQRHLATRPGYLEWAWKVVAPIFRDHSAQSIGWEAADSLEFSSGNVTSEMEQYFSEHPAAAVEIKNIFHSFIRVSPTNLVVSYILKQRLSGIAEPNTAIANQNADTSLRRIAALPPMLKPLPALVDVSSLSFSVQQSMKSLSTEVDGKEFIPGLYRMLGHWPEYLVHVASKLSELRQTGQIDSSLQELPRNLDQQSQQLERNCPEVVPPIRPGSSSAAEIIKIIDNYRVTSPEMVVYSRYLLDELKHV